MPAVRIGVDLEVLGPCGTAHATYDGGMCASQLMAVSGPKFCKTRDICNASAGHAGVRDRPHDGRGEKNQVGCR